MLVQEYFSKGSLHDNLYGIYFLSHFSSWISLFLLWILNLYLALMLQENISRHDVHPFKTEVKYEVLA